MQGRFLQFFAAVSGCLIVLCLANGAIAAGSETTHGSAATGDAAAAVPAAPAAAALADPGELTGYRGKVGQTFVFTVTGTTDGSIWGEGTYTDDSKLSTAAVHAGIVKPGETKDVTVQILPGQQSYPGAFDFGVASNSYAAWQGSYKFLDKPMTEADTVFPDPGNLKDYEGKIGKTMQFSITGATDGSVWGDGIYTDDSDLDTAAVEAGLVKDGDDATVRVKILPGQGKYRAGKHNGIQTEAYGKFGGSYEFVDADGAEIKPKG